VLNAAWTIVALVLAAGPAGGHIDTAVSNILAISRVRTESPEVRRLIEDTASRSRTVRELLARLAQTDTIVYVEFTPSPLVPTARTKLVTTASGARFLRIGININAASGDRGPWLGHELQHALEIAERRDIRDENAVRALYHQIGRSHGTDQFETDGARSVEWTVRSELRIKMGG
jgi:hypothetical protein